MKTTLAGVVLFLLAGISCGGGSRRPDIILITVESQRTDHLTPYGYSLDTSPGLAGLASEATLYENAYSVTSWTLPAHASIFTGLYPPTHRVQLARDRLDESYTTLAEDLSRAGYQTAGFISGPLLQKQHGLAQGFGRYDESSSNPEGSLAAHADRTNPRMEALVMQFLQEEREEGRPLFLFVYLWDPHYDYIPPPPCDTRFVPPGAEPVDLLNYETSGVVTPGISPPQLEYVISQYDGEIRCTDDLLGRLFEELKRLGLWNNSLVAVTSDHGEEFFDHGRKGHKHNLHEESVHVPLVIKYPGGAVPARDTRLVSLVDLYPTLLSAVGEARPDYLQGRSLLEPDTGRDIYFELNSEWVYRNAATGELEFVPDIHRALRRGDLKLIEERNDRRTRVYDIVRDPTEQRPLSTTDRLADLQGALANGFDSMGRAADRWEVAGPAELTPEQEERLRSLGYVSSPDGQ